MIRKVLKRRSIDHYSLSREYIYDVFIDDEMPINLGDQYLFNGTHIITCTSSNIEVSPERVRIVHVQKRTQL